MSACLWNRDPRIAEPLLAALRADPRLIVGDNEPYDARDDHGYSMKRHAEDTGLPHGLHRDPPGPDRHAPRRRGMGVSRRRRAVADPGRIARSTAPNGPDHGRRTALHHRHRGGISPGRPRDPRAGDRAAGGHDGRARPARLAGQVTPEFLQFADRGRHARLPEHCRGVATICAGCAAPWPRPPTATASPSSPPRPIPSRALGPPDATPTRSATTSSRATCRASARRLLICGMHVHVGLDDDDLRIDLMSQVGYFLPHLLALSHLLAVLAGRVDRPQVLPHFGLRRAAAHRHARAFRQLWRIPAPGPGAGLGRADRGRHQALVGHPALGALPDARDARLRHPHAARGHALRRRALSSASCACSGACAAPTSAGAAMPACWSTRTAGAPSATASTRGWSISARA